MKNLPATNDEFWSDNDTEQFKVEKPEIPSEHYIVRHGNTFICTSCPYKHTLNVSAKKYDAIDGKLVKVKLTTNNK